MIYNIGFSLEYDYCSDSHIRCPHCKQGYNVEWDSEYGDPDVGDHECHCPNCEKDFHFSVYHQYNSRI